MNKNVYKNGDSTTKCQCPEVIQYYEKNKRVSEMAVIYHTCLQVYTNLKEFLIYNSLRLTN